MRHHYADVGDVQLHYVTAGRGPAVVLLGWPQTWYMWRGVMPKLAGDDRVIAPDLRGLGDSSRPVGGYDKKTLAEDIWRLVHDALASRVSSSSVMTGADRLRSRWPRSTETP